MIQYNNEQLATVIAVPIVAILLVWTTAIFHKNRRKWGPYDIPIVVILVLSILRNLTILSYTLVIILNQTTFNLEYCGIVVWLFNSIHTFQASCLTTLAVVGLFSAKLHGKNQNLKQFLTPTHLIYHMFCLTTLCACVGVAAILAQNDRGAKFESILIFETNPCRFMPYDLDIKYNAFVIVLHAFLASISVVSFVLICHTYFQLKKNGFDYLKKSNSDLSELSLGVQNDTNKNYYDTYTIQRRGVENFYDGNAQEQSVGFQNGFCHRETVWNSDVSNISTTVSSTNSRRPCLGKQLQDEFENRTGLETIHPVLIACYLFYHLPIIVLCIYPKLIAPWQVAGLALWLGLIQDLLIPIGLGLIDSRFCSWVSNVYRCNGRRGSDKLPHGLDGKFRPFGGSQPQSLEISHTQQERNGRSLQAVEHRFPITNGSLYTSIDGRLPVIHNYRRHKDYRGNRSDSSNQQINFITTKKPNDYQSTDHQQYCRNCETDLCPSHSNLHHLSPHYVNRQLNFFHNNNLLLDRNHLQKRVSVSQESLRQRDLIFDGTPSQHDNPAFQGKPNMNLVRLNKLRLSKSEDSLHELQIQRNLGEIKQNPLLFRESKNENILDCSSSDDEYATVNQNFDSLSSNSCYSITTEANCDFEFYQNNDKNNKNRYDFNNVTKIEVKPTNFKDSLTDLNHNLRITRSNSKRSLENFQSFINGNIFTQDVKVQRSNSYVTPADQRLCNRHNKKLLRSDSKLSDCTHNIKQKIKSVEYLPSSNASTVYIEDVCYYNLHNRNNGIRNNYVGSVPDLKKVFISEYI